MSEKQPQECPHPAWQWYSGFDGYYRVCRTCGYHAWGGEPPDDADVMDLLNFKDDIPEQWMTPCAKCGLEHWTILEEGYNTGVYLCLACGNKVEAAI